MAINTNAKIGDGATLLLGVAFGGTNTALATNEATSNYTSVAQVLTFSPNLECSEHDVTHMASGGVRQWIPGHLSATVQMTINLTPAFGSTNDTGSDSDVLLDVYQAKTNRKWMFQIPTARASTSDSSLYSVAFWGFPTSMTMSADRDAPNTADITIRVADSIMVEQALAADSD